MHPRPLPHLRRNRHAAAALALCAAHAASLAQPAAPPTPAPTQSAGAIATIIDRELRARSIRIIGLDRVELTVIDDRGERRSVPLSELIAIVPTNAPIDPRTGVGAVVGAAPAIDAEILQRRIAAGETGFVETIDGQRLIGQPGESTGDAEAVLWMHPRLGPVRIDLERIRTVAMPGAGARALTLEHSTTEDILTLINGDRLRGLIASLADPVIVENSTGTSFEVARDSVAGATLANPLQPRSGPMVWLGDGTVVRFAGASSTAGDTIDLSFESGAESAYSIAEIRAMGLDAGRLVPLSDLSPVDQSADPRRRTTPPIELARHPDDEPGDATPTLGALDIRFPGPMAVTWNLPRGTQRIAATAALAPDTAPWGDCEIVVSVDGQEILRDHLEPGRPAVAINLPVRGTTLSIAIEAGNHGPINDRVTLHRPLLLLAAPR